MADRIGLAITSPTLFQVARDAASARRTDLGRGLTAVVFAAASLEALINEVTELVDIEVQHGNNDELLQAFVEAMLEVERSRGSTHLKFIIASTILSRRPYRRGSQPFQDFSLLMSVRDAIMHLRPTTLMHDEAGAVRIGAGKAFDQLRARGLVNSPQPNSVTTLLAETSRPLVSRWAVNAAADMAQSFLSLFPEPFQSEVLIDQAEVFRRIDTEKPA